MKFVPLILMIFVLPCSWANESEHKVLQVGKTFIKPVSDETVSSLKNKRGKFRKTKVKEHHLKEITIKQGDSVVFVNKDNVEHNVFGKDFDYYQKKGSENRHTFKEPGTRIVRCAIHPKMKLKVKVEPKAD